MISTAVSQFILILPIISKISCITRFSRDVNFDNIGLEYPDSGELDSVSLVNCSRVCHEINICRSFAYNYSSGRCQVFPKIFGHLWSPKVEQGTAVFRKADDRAMCDVPVSIPRGQIFYIDGQQEGSKAVFDCDLFHFPNVAYGECRSGEWIGLDEPCIQRSPPFKVPVEGKIEPGSCCVLMAAPRLNENFLVASYDTQESFAMRMSFRNYSRMIVRNSHINGDWGLEETDIPSWPLVDSKVFNLTVCVEPHLYRVHIDNVEMFTFNHRLPPMEVVSIFISEGLTLHNITFTV